MEYIFAAGVGIFTGFFPSLALGLICVILLIIAWSLTEQHAEKNWPAFSKKHEKLIKWIRKHSIAVYLTLSILAIFLFLLAANSFQN